jgi:hypothetical protein
MTAQIICDGCGAPLEEGADYASAMFSVFEAPQGNQAPEPPTQVQLHWHPEHVPDGLTPYEAPDTGSEPEPEPKGKE